MQIEDKEKRILLGSVIDHPERDWAFLVQMFLDQILDQLNEARLVLTLIEGNCGVASEVKGRDQQMHLIYAKLFVYALDTAGQLIRVLQKQENLPAPAREHCRRFLVQFGELQELLNSLQPIEDRLRGLSRNGKPIPNLLLALGEFRNKNYFGATAAEGHYMEIEISSSVLLQACTIIEDLIWCFDWLGPGNIRLERQPTMPNTASRKYTGIMHWTGGIRRHFHLCLRQGAGKQFSLDSPSGQAGFELFLLPSRVRLRVPREDHTGQAANRWEARQRKL